MTRLIVITFVALGWAFFVMSGGTDFEPRGQRGAAPEQIAKVEPPKPAPVFQPKVIASNAEALVTNVAARTVSTGPEPASTPIAEDILLEVDDSEDTTLPQLSAFANPGSSFTLASLEDGAVGLQQISVVVQNDVAPQPAQPEPQKDIREISGTRVNMRDGPGTIYPIIGKVTIGQQVEVLSDSGTGWLRLRVLPEQQIGWVSSSLVR